MSNKCKWCGKNFLESEFQIQGESVCSQDCQSKMKFSYSFWGNIYQPSLVPILGGIMMIWLLLLWSPLINFLYGYNLMDRFTPYIISSSIFLMIPVISTSSNTRDNVFELPSSILERLFTSQAFPYWIIFVNYLYVIVFYTTLFFAGDIVDKSPRGIPFTQLEIELDSVNILGLNFNYGVANILLFLSLMSVLVIVAKVRNSST